MVLNPYNITLHVYAQDQQEAQELENALRDFVIEKYGQAVYVRAASLTKLVKQYGKSPIVNNFIR
jgi:hypothetical protein